MIFAKHDFYDLILFSKPNMFTSLKEAFKTFIYPWIGVSGMLVK